MWPKRYSIFCYPLPFSLFIRSITALSSNACPLQGFFSSAFSPTEKVHWIINSKYVRWRSVPFPFVHSNVVAFSYNFGCKYNFFLFYLALALSLFPHLLETMQRGLRRDPREKKKKPNSKRLCKCGHGPLQSAAPVKTNNMDDKVQQTSVMWYNCSVERVQLTTARNLDQRHNETMVSLFFFFFHFKLQYSNLNCYFIPTLPEIDDFHVNVSVCFTWSQVYKIDYKEIGSFVIVVKHFLYQRKINTNLIKSKLKYKCFDLIQL